MIYTSNNKINVEGNGTFIPAPSDIVIDRKTSQKVSGLATANFGLLAWTVYQATIFYPATCMAGNNISECIKLNYKNQEIAKFASMIFGGLLAATLISGLAFYASVAYAGNTYKANKNVI